MGNTGSGRPDWQSGWRVIKDNILLNRVTAFVLLFLGLILLAGSGFEIKQGYDSLSWTKTSGTVVKSEAKQDHHYDKYSWLGKKYYPDIQYQYSVNGRQYSSSEISVADWFITRNLSEIEAITTAYPLNGKVPVYYDPALPGKSLLEIGIPGRVIWALVAGFIIVISAIIMLVAIIRNRKQQQGK